MPSRKIVARITIIAVVLIVSLIAAVFTFDRAFSRVQGSPPRHRPSGIPPNAVWAGGPDGGSYFLCTVDSGRNVNPCTIWNEETGQKILSEDFWVSGEDRAATAAELKYAWYDGLVIGMHVLTAEKKYLALERVSGLKPMTVCELIANVSEFENGPVAVIGRLDVTNEGKLLSQKGCQVTLPGELSRLRVLDAGGPHPPMGQLYTNHKAVRAKLALLKSGTALDDPPKSPMKEFQSWAVVYGRVEQTKSSIPPITLVSSGYGLEFVFDN